MRKTIAFLLIVAAGLLFAQLVHAQSPRALEREVNRASAAAEKQTDELARLKTRGDTMISVRLTSLQKLLARVQSDKQLSDSDKTSLENDINATINSLNTLKAKIDADTDLTTLRADVKSIVTTYRIFEIYEPKVRLLVIINNLQSLDATLTTLTGKIQNLLTQLKTQGKDVTSAQTALTDAETQLTTISSLLTADKTLVANVTVSTTNPQSVFVQVRKDLATARADFAKFRADIAQIRSVLKIVLPKGTVTVHPTESSESAK